MSEGSRSFHILLAGLWAGLSLGALLLGLNAHLAPFPAIFRLAGGCAALGVFLFSPFALIRSASPQASRFFWAVMVASSASLAVLAESQRLLYYSFLPNAIRRQLVAVSLAALLAAFFWAWALFVPPGPKRTWALLALGTGFLLLTPLSIQSHGEPLSLAPAPLVPKTASRSVLVIGLEGVSWETVAAGASDGTLPVFRKLLQDGVAGPLEPLKPYDRDALWTTAATGKRPAKHGVITSNAFDSPLGRLLLVPRPFRLSPPTQLPFSHEVPLRGISRRSLAFWEILAARGHKSAVANWPGSFPARDGLVLWAADVAFQDQTGVPPPDSVAPKDAAVRIQLFRVDSKNLEKSLVASLVPKDLPLSDAARANPLGASAGDLSVAGLTLATLPGGRASASIVVFSGISGVSRLFGPSLAHVTYSGLSPRHADVRARALTAYYRFLDELIGEFVEREGRERTIFVFSPVSFGPPSSVEGLVRFARNQEPEAVPYGLEPGFLMISGSGIRSGARLTSATVFDVAPTILALSGEPIARDFDGRVLSEAFDERFAETATFPVVMSFEPGGPQ